MKYCPQLKDDRPIVTPSLIYNHSPQFIETDKIQGKFYISVGNDETGGLSPKGAIQFQEKMGQDRAIVDIHDKGHCADTDYLLKKIDEIF